MLVQVVSKATGVVTERELTGEFECGEAEAEVEETYFYDGGDDWWDYRQRRLQGDEYFYESRLRGAQLLDPWRR